MLMQNLVFICLLMSLRDFHCQKKCSVIEARRKEYSKKEGIQSEIANADEDRESHMNCINKVIDNFYKYHFIQKSKLQGGAKKSGLQRTGKRMAGVDVWESIVCSFQNFSCLEKADVNGS